MGGALAAVARLFEEAGVAYALIGAHAVNAWIEPRVTADVDITAQVSHATQERLEAVFCAAGFELARAEGANLSSGPDFLRFVSLDRLVIVEIQAVKTEFQDRVVERAIAAEDGVRVATPEDLIVLKLIANRPKDHVDLLGLVQLDRLDWTYLEHWAGVWEVLPLLRGLRHSE